MLAQEEAERSHHTYIGTEHLLLGLLREGEGLAARVLADLGVDTAMVRHTIESVLVRNERTVIQQIIPTSRVKTVIELSFTEARRMGSDHVGTEHMLLGLLEEGEGIGAHVLSDLGATLEKVRAAIERLGPGDSVEPRPPPFHAGQRVLVHDEHPPHRLWEGRIQTAEESQVVVAIPGRPEGEIVTAKLSLVHPVPMTWTRDCPLCTA